MKKKILSLFISLFILTLFAFAKNEIGLFWLNGNLAKIVGKVVNEKKEPLKGAIVVVPETGDSAETNIRGVFSLFIPKK